MEVRKVRVGRKAEVRVGERYRVEKIFHGGFGLVYAAKASHTSEPLALKVKPIEGVSKYSIPKALMVGMALWMGWGLAHLRRWAYATAAVVLVVLMLLPSAGPFRWSFRWLPLFHLALALLGAIDDPLGGAVGLEGGRFLCSRRLGAGASGEGRDQRHKTLTLSPEGEALIASHRE